MLDKTPRNIIEFHRSMLEDATRTEALRRAIAAAVKPGDLVLDLGCGTGILSFFALQSGARRVYAVEASGVIELAKAVAAENGLEDRIRFFDKLSTSVELPERADLLMTETIGNFGLEEGILNSVIDARRRLLKEGGTIVPRSLELIVAPVEVPELYEQFSFWSGDLYGLDFTAARSLSINNPLWTELKLESCLGEPQPLAHIDLAEVTADEMTGEAPFVAVRSGMMHGIGGWFATELGEGVVLSNAPPLEVPSWRHGFLPLQQPIAVADGDELRVAIHATANGGIWRWLVAHRARDAAGSGAQKADQSTFFGSLISPAGLRKLASGHQPRLDEEGAIDHYVLGLMRGDATLDAMAQRLAREFPRRFPTPAKGLARVRELSHRYSRS